MPFGEILSFNVAYLSVIPLPEKALISGNLACKANSKFEASYTSNSSIFPAAFGKEMIVFDDFLSTMESNTCLNGSKLRLNNLMSEGKDNLAVALSATILRWLWLFKDQKLFVCVNPETVSNTNTVVWSNSFFIVEI